MKIGAILSDYDGTLAPTTSVTDQFDNKILLDLVQVLWKISGKISISILTSKDYEFVHNKTMFAKAASCILGIETLLLNHTRLMEKDHNYDCVTSCTLSCDLEILQKNSHLLSSVADIISKKFRELKIEHKLTFQERLLVGITIDWRHLHNWNSVREEVEFSIMNLVSEYNNDTQNHYPLYLHTYSTHPFIDIYSTKCSKSTAFERVVDGLNISKNIMYLGDSENDNPAFQKADLSIGVISDPRLSPRLDCDYLIDFKLLSEFLRNLYNNDFVFNNDMIP
ncbi:MAG TPA: HAD hydrolase family protein [Nitrososphaeraceae archaeon]|jgi:HAD superfamily hydrolase (TIGR01484 family)